MEQFQTPVTIVRPPDTATPPVVATPPIPISAPVIPATLPRPAALDSAVQAGVTVVKPSANPGAVMTARPRGGFVRRIAWMGVLLIVIGMFTSEAVAWLAAERFRAGVTALDLRDVAAARQQYDRLRGASPLRVATRVRVDEALGRRLISLADGVLADFRQDRQSRRISGASRVRPDWASHSCGIAD